jgi:hypothetical protein
LKYERERNVELDTCLQNAYLEVKSLKDAQAAIEDKNKQLVKKLEELMQGRTGLSVMDFKIQFGKADREMARGRLLQEVAQLRREEVVGDKGLLNNNKGADVRT